MNTKNRSTLTFFVLVAILTLTAGLNLFLPQGAIGTSTPQSQIPKWQLALGSAAFTAALYSVPGIGEEILFRLFLIGLTEDTF
jgi:membrane protease YdiL (CAAX protease family)